MATSEPLVPNDLPYGSRQDVREGMQRAGIPTAPSSLPSPAAPGGGVRAFVTGTDAGVRPPRPDFDPLLEATPDQFPFLGQPGEGASAPAPPDNAAVFTELAARAGSGFAQAVAARLAARRGR